MLSSWTLPIALTITLSFSHTVFCIDKLIIKNNVKNETSDLETRDGWKYYDENDENTATGSAYGTTSKQQTEYYNDADQAYESKTPYEQNNNNLAQVIRDNQQSLTLKDIYGTAPNLGPYAASGANTVRKQTLLDLEFEPDFAQFNPRDANISQFHWRGDGTDFVSDNAALVRVPSTAAAAAYKNSPYAYKKKKTNGYVELISVPFAAYDPPGGNGSNYFEGVAQWNNVPEITETQRILFRLKAACRTINTENHPFPQDLVRDSQDDDRLASCYMSLNNDAATLYIFITNKSVWAGVLGLSPDTGDYTFIARRRIGIRKSYNDIVDGGIEIDGRQKVINFYLNGYKVWTYNPVGLPPPADGVTKIDFGSGTPGLAFPGAFLLRFGTRKFLDLSDANNANSQVRLVDQMGLGSSLYGPNAVFYDPARLRSNVLWGQGAIMKLYRLEVLLADSVNPVTQTSTLPVVQIPAYAQQMPSSTYYKQKKQQQKPVNNNYYETTNAAQTWMF